MASASHLGLGGGGGGGGSSTAPVLYTQTVPFLLRVPPHGFDASAATAGQHQHGSTSSSPASAFAARVASQNNPRPQFAPVLGQPPSTYPSGVAAAPSPTSAPRSSIPVPPTPLTPDSVAAAGYVDSRHPGITVTMSLHDRGQSLNVMGEGGIYATKPFSRVCFFPAENLDVRQKRVLTIVRSHTSDLDDNLDGRRQPVLFTRRGNRRRRLPNAACPTKLACRLCSVSLQSH